MGYIRDGKNKPVRYLPVRIGQLHGIVNYPNIDKTGSVKGMKRMYWGIDALVVRCGSYYYNVTSNPDLYYRGY